MIFAIAFILRLEMNVLAGSLVVQAAALEERVEVESEVDSEIDLILEDVSEPVVPQEELEQSSIKKTVKKSSDGAEEAGGGVVEKVAGMREDPDSPAGNEHSLNADSSDLAEEVEKNEMEISSENEAFLEKEQKKESISEGRSILNSDISLESDISKGDAREIENSQGLGISEKTEKVTDGADSADESVRSAVEKVQVSKSEKELVSDKNHSLYEIGLREDAIVRAIRAARPAVVNIRGEKLMKSVPYDASGTKSHGEANVPNGSESPHVNGMGTGVLFDPRGYIVTNFHVVDGIQEIHVTTADSKTYVAQILARDRETDLAIIKIEALAGEVFETIQVGESSDLMTGETVIAVGNAYGYEHTVTKGIISALHRSVQVSDVQFYQDLIQTDASINPGNSGGPLLNIKGEMIGINVAVRAGAQGIGFAIPVNRAMEVVTRMAESCGTSRNWHGIGFVSHPIGSSRGAVVEHVEKNSPAEAIGLRAGDVILGVNQKKISNELDFACSILEMRSGETIRISVMRNQEVATVKLALGAVASQNRVVSDYAPEIADRPAFHVEKLTNEEVIWKQMGVLVSPIKGNDIPIHGSRSYNGGLLVQNVRPNSPAARQGIRNGDVLLGIFQWETLTLDNVIFILGHPEFQNQKNVKFLLARDGQVFRGSFAVGDFKNTVRAETASAAYPAAR